MSLSEYNNLIFYVIVTVLIQTGASSYNSLHEKIDTMNYQKNIMPKAVVDVIINFFQMKTTTVNIYQAFSDKKNFDIQSDIINDVLRDINHEILVHMESESERNMHNRLRQHGIFLVDSYKSFHKIYRKMDLDLFDYEGFYLIVVTTNIENYILESKKILEDCWLKYIVNANVMIKSPKMEKVFMLTYFPWNRYYCEKIHPVHLENYDSSVWNNGLDFFPDKTANFHKCPIKVATFETKPFMSVKRLKDGKILLGGLEGNMLNLLADILNFSLDVVLVPEQWGVVFSNGTGNGAVGLVSKNLVNVTVGYFGQTKARNTLMKNGIFYQSYKIKWAVPPGREFPPIEKLLKPLNYSVWLCTFGIFIASLITATFLEHQFTKLRNFVIGEQVKHPSLNIVNISMGGSVPHMPQRNFARYLFGLFSFYCLVIRSSYQGALYQYLQIDLREKIVETTEEMVTRNFSFYMLPSGESSKKQFDKEMVLTVLKLLNGILCLIETVSCQC